MPFEYFVRAPLATAAKGGRSVAKEIREILHYNYRDFAPPLSSMKRLMPALTGHAIGIPLTLSINVDAL